MSADPPEIAAHLARELEIPFPLLCDPGFLWLDRLGLRHRPAYMKRDIAAPAGILVDAAGRVLWTFQGAHTQERAGPGDVLAAARSLATGGD